MKRFLFALLLVGCGGPAFSIGARETDGGAAGGAPSAGGAMNAAGGGSTTAVSEDGGLGGAGGSAGGSGGAVGSSVGDAGGVSAGGSSGAMGLVKDASDGAIPICGDGKLDPGEACDDGNIVQGDGCQNDCTVSCVNPVTDCVGKTPACQSASCDANGVCQSAADVTKNGVACAVADSSATCHDGACTAGTCGNSIKEAGEECDDGNTTNGDGCDNDCLFSCSGNASCDDGDPCNGRATCVSVPSGQKCKAGNAEADGTVCGIGRVCESSICRFRG